MFPVIQILAPSSCLLPPVASPARVPIAFLQIMRDILERQGSAAGNSCETLIPTGEKPTMTTCAIYTKTLPPTPETLDIQAEACQQYAVANVLQVAQGVE